MSTWKAYIGRLFGGGLNKAPAVGFVTEYSLSDGEDQARIAELKRPDGLLGWHAVSGGPGKLRLFCYWLTKDAFERNQASWQTALGTPCTLIYDGLVGKFAPEKGNFSRWTTVLQTVVLALAGILAAMTTIRNASDTILAKPHIALRDERKTMTCSSPKASRPRWS